MKKTNKKELKYGLTEHDLQVYDYLSIAFGIGSILTSLTGFFGIMFGLLGLCIGMTYYECTKNVRLGLILNIIGSLISSGVMAYILMLCYA